MTIPRGIIYHSVGQDLRYLAKSLTADLTDTAQISAFEREFAACVGRAHCVAFPFARVAIHHVLQAQNFPRGAEIIMPPITIKAILDVVLHAGLTPVFVDLDPTTLCFDPNKLSAAISGNTRAIIITYLFGIVPDLDRIAALCRARGLFVIEDFSQCLNGRHAGRNVGTFGDVGVYSASSTKTLDTYGGGLLVCDDAALAGRMRAARDQLAPPRRADLIAKIVLDLLRNLATRSWIFTCLTFPLIRMLDLLSPGSVQKHTGDRSSAPIATLPAAWFRQFTSLQAEIGLSLLRELHPQDEARRANVARIQQGVTNPAIRFPTGADKADNVFWQLVADIPQVGDVQKQMWRSGVDTSRTSLLIVASLPDYPGSVDMPVARHIYQNAYFVPAYPRLSPRRIARVIQALNAIR